jgi:hypothetical protein
MLKNKEDPKEKMPNRMPEEANKVLEALKGAAGESNEKLTTKLDGFDHLMRIDLLHNKNLNAYQNMM